MEHVRNKVVSGELPPSGRQAETIAQYTETMSAVERLCSQSGETLVTLGRRGNEGFYSFVRKMMVWIDKKEHPTTSAQCISAIQDLLRALDGIKLTQPEPANLPFQPLAKGKVDKGSLKKLRTDLQDTLEAQMAFLANSQLAKPPAVFADSAQLTKPSDNSAGADWFGELNPFTCAHTFRALGPSEYLISKGCWSALFGIFWALKRTYPNYRGASGVAMPHSLPTAFVTSHCIDAIESLVQALGRREARFDCLIDLIAELENLKGAASEREYPEILLDHQNRTLCTQIVTSLREIAQDAVLKKLFDSWLKNISDLESCSFSADQLKVKFIEAYSSCKSEIAKNLETIEIILTSLNKNVVRPIGKIAKALDDGNPKLLPSSDGLPDGLVERRYHEATNRYKKNPAKLPWMKDPLERYWKDQSEAVDKALCDCKGLQSFLEELVDCYGSVELLPPLSDQLRSATGKLLRQRENLHELLKGAVTWSEGELNHQLSLFRSAKMGAFDAAELAHAARTVSRTEAPKHAAGVLESIDAICTTQNPDGNWPSSKPFFWTHGGVAAFPHSAEVAWALVSIMRTVVKNPETFGMGQSEALARLDKGNQTLRRYLGWLSATAHTYPLPELLCEEKGKLSDGSEHRQVFGWSSDRTPEPNLVHAWATANVVEFLVEFRDLLQDQINTALRIEFLSYHPSDLPHLKDFPTPDLSNPDYEKRIGTWLRHELQKHIERAKRETHWIPEAKYGNEELKFFSAILAGPPGSAKSYLAKCIAGELGWPLIAFSPSDFLSAGEANVEARAREIFDSLMSGSRVVYFFDEIDELIVDRAHTQREQGRSVFSFLTPSFLTKLQDLRDAAQRKGFLFLIGTNYLDRIDPAAKRTGRIDKQVFILYPDFDSRKARIFEQLREEFKPKKKGSNKKRDGLNIFWNLLNKRSSLDSIVTATALLSIPALDRVCKEIYRASLDREAAFWTTFNQNINNEGGDKSVWVKRDVNLSVYWERPGAVDEWCQMMDLVPKEYQSGGFHGNQLKGYLSSLTERWKLHEERVKEQIRNHNSKWFDSTFE